MRPIKIYTASKVRHAERMRKLKLEADGIHFNARWPDTAPLPQNSTKPASQWLIENIDDINACDVMFIYAEEGEHLKTALFEAGCAFILGKPIWVIGQAVTPSEANNFFSTVFHPDYEPWCRASNRIKRANNFEEAIKAVKLFFKANDVQAA